MMKKIEAQIMDLSIRKLLSYATSEQIINQEYIAYIHCSNRKLYVFEFEGEMIGCIGIEFVDCTSCEIKHLAVSPLHRGKGIGSKMIQFIFQVYSIHTLYAETDRDAVNFYRNYGFEITSLGEKYLGVERFSCIYKR